MGRPLNLEPTPVDGGASASLPVVRGSRRRRTHTFTAGGPDLALANARTWLAEGAAALAAGRSLPDPGLYDRPADTAPHATGRATLAAAIDATLHRRYGIAQFAQPDRVADIRGSVEGILLPWFNARAANDHTIGLDEVTAAMVHAFVLHLAGRDVGVDEDGVQWTSEIAIDLDVAAWLCNRPAVTIVHVAAIHGIDLSVEQPRVSPAQLVGMDLLDARTHPLAFGYARDYSAHVLRTLTWAVVDAVAAGHLDRDVTAGRQALEPDDIVRRRAPAREKKRPLRLPEARRVLSRLHLVHQVVALIQRLCGPRVAEAYGPRVRDLADHVTFGILHLTEQGGNQFLERDKYGRVGAVSHKERLKNPWSERVVVVPGALMPLLRLVIEVFHTDADGVVDLDARLVPGLRKEGTAGVAGYRQALKQAFEAEGLTYERLGFYPNTHWLRASLATDLKNANQLTDQSVLRVLGHRPGEEVSDWVYYLDDPDNLEPFAQIADTLDKKIADQLGDLLIPTVLPDFGHDHPVRDRLAHVRDVLTQAGWLASESDAPDTPCGSARVADELGVAEGTARRWMREGVLPASVETIGSIERRVACLGDVAQLRAELDRQTTLADLARALEVDYHHLYRLVRHLELDIPQDELTGTFHLTGDQCDRIRYEHARITALNRRAVRVGMAARELAIGDRRVRHLLASGQLQVDPETDLSGYRFVTRTSIEAYRQRTRPAPPPDGDGYLTIAEAAGITGLSRDGIRALIDASLLTATLHGRQQVITLAALRDWAAGHRPELLPDLAAGQP